MNHWARALSWREQVEASDTRSIMCYTNPKKHGYLKKVTPGVIRNAEERLWFVMKENTLYYLESPPALGKAPQLCGMVPLDSHPAYQLAAQKATGNQSHHDRCIELFCTKPDGSRQHVKGLKVRREPVHPMATSAHPTAAGSP